MTDIKELRRLAEAATQGEWKSMYTARKSNPSEKDKFYSVSALSPAIPGWCDAQNIDIATICKIYDGTDASNSEFIAAANPSAILSLLDKIDAQEKEIAELRKDAEIAHKKFELSLEFMSKILRFFRPITKANLWERINQFGEEYNSKLELIDPDTSTQEVG